VAVSLFFCNIIIRWYDIKIIIENLKSIQTFIQCLDRWGYSYRVYYSIDEKYNLSRRLLSIRLYILDLSIAVVVFKLEMKYSESSKLQTIGSTKYCDSLFFIWFLLFFTLFHQIRCHSNIYIKIIIENLKSIQTFIQRLDRWGYSYRVCYSIDEKYNLSRRLLNIRLYILNSSIAV
jgi:hypothetical protein